MTGKNEKNSKFNYPFAIVGVNLCLLLIDLLHLRDQNYLSIQAGYWQVFEDKLSFFEVFYYKHVSSTNKFLFTNHLCTKNVLKIYCMLFFHIDHQWSERNLVRAQFGDLISK